MDTPDNNELDEQAGNNEIDEQSAAANRPEPKVGQLLRSARLEQGISVQDVARQLRFSAKQVTALEEDKYDQLAGGTFLRGFVRNYAKLLQLDEAPLLRVLEKSVPPSAAQIVPPPVEGIPFPSNRGQRKRILIIAGGVVIALVLLVYEIYRSNDASTAKQPSVGAETRMEGATAILLPPPQAASGGGGEGLKQDIPDTVAGGVTPAPANGQPASAAAVPGSEGTHGDAAAVAGPSASGIQLVFEGESWTEVRDGRDQLLLSSVNPAGTEQILHGAPPYSLVIGNAADVKLVYNGKPVDLAPYTNLYGGTARLTLE